MLTKFGKIYPPEGSPIAGHSPVCRHPLGENKESVEQRVFKGLPIAYSVEIRFYKAYELAHKVWKNMPPRKAVRLRDTVQFSDIRLGKIRDQSR